MNEVKRHRFDLPVRCHPGDRVADYVPFYLCPRSIMLFIIHLVADLHTAVAAAEDSGRRWAFTTSHAGAAYAQFFTSLEHLDRISWEAVAARDLRDAARVHQALQGAPHIPSVTVATSSRRTRRPS